MRQDITDFSTAQWIDAVPDQAAVLDDDAKIVAVNAAWTDFAVRNGGRAQGWIGQDYLAALRSSPRSHDAVRDVVKRVLPEARRTYPCPTLDGVRWFRMVARPLADDHTLVCHIDVTTDRQRVMALVDDSPLPMAELDDELSAVLVNATWAEITGQAPGEAEGAGWLDLVRLRDRSRLREVLNRSITDQVAVQVDVRQADGARRWMRVSARPLSDDGGLVMSLTDVSRDRQMMDHLRHRVAHDELTGLATRETLNGALTAALRVDPTPGHEIRCAVAFIDVDDFKAVNDTHGHAVGDEVLKATAARLTGALRTGDLAARLSGDEFGALIRRVDSVADADALGRRLIDRLVEPVATSGGLVEVTASVGIALVGREDPSPSADQVIELADDAMYVAKHGGKARAEVRTTSAGL